MRKVTSQNHQTIFDICLQHMGSVNALIDVMTLNPTLRFDQELNSGTVIILPDTPINKTVTSYYAKNKIVPVSGGLNPVSSSESFDTIIIINQSFEEVFSSGFDLGFLCGYLRINIHFTAILPKIDLFNLSLLTSEDGTLYTDIPGSNRTVMGGGSIISTSISDIMAWGRYIKLRINEIEYHEPITINKLIFIYEKYR